jgi:transcriptional regulator
MYSPPAFREVREEVLHSFIRAHPLGTLVTNGADGPEATHLPFFLDDSAGLLRCHMARANPQWKQLESGGRVLVVFTGADHYVSPGWYPEKREHGKVVPTWNYAAVHVSGTARLFDDHPSLLRHLHELTDFEEAAFEEPWSVADAPREFIEGMARAVVGIEIKADRIEGKWKLGQNRSAADQLGVAAGLESLDSRAATEMAALIRGHRSYPGRHAARLGITSPALALKVLNLWRKMKRGVRRVLRAYKPPR